MLTELLLDARTHVVGQRMLARGGLHALALHARDALRPVVREAVSAFVLVHNHPGGDPCPSDEDVRFTQRIFAAAEVLGVADRTGSLEVGKIANVVAWSGEPLTKETTAKMVFVDGTLYEPEAKEKEKEKDKDKDTI